MSTLKTIKWLFSISDGSRMSIFFLSGLNILKVSFALTFILVSKRTIDIATNTEEGNFIICSLLLIIILVSQLLTGIIYSWYSMSTQTCLSNKLKLNLFDKLLACKWNALEKFHSGDIMNRIEQDSNIIVTLFVSTIPQTISLIFQILMSVSLFAILDYRLTVVICSIFFSLSLFSLKFGKKMRQHLHNIKKSNSQIQSVIQESIQYRSLIKTYQKEKSQTNKLDTLQNQLKKQIKQQTTYNLSVKSLLASILAFSYLTVFLWSAWQLKVGIITFGTLTALLQLANKLQKPILEISRFNSIIISSITASERLIEISELGTEVIYPKREQSNNTPIIRLENISFSYEKSSMIFTNFSHVFKPGSKTAILGGSGSGKTTFARLLLGLIQPEAGSIYLIDDTKKISISEKTRSFFSYIPQGNTLISGTIRENLLLGKEQASDLELIQVLKLCEAHFVFDLPAGIDSHLSERGGSLSEGQAQRIIIARALLRECNILIFDEATSALDKQTEIKVIHNLFKAFPEKTFLLITHNQNISEICSDTITIKH